MYSKAYNPGDQVKTCNFGHGTIISHPLYRVDLSDRAGEMFIASVDIQDVTPGLFTDSLKAWRYVRKYLTICRDLLNDEQRRGTHELSNAADKLQEAIMWIDEYVGKRESK